MPPDRVGEHRFDAPAPGTHMVALATDTPARPGVYLLRLTQGGRSLQARACVLK